jgi:hypothetical protein
MRTILCIALISTLYAGVSSHGHAVSSRNSVLSAKIVDLPLIPLEKSLIPLRSPVESIRNISSLPNNNLTQANAIVRGLLVANRTGEIAYAAPLSYKVQDVVRSLRRGNSLGKAQKHGGVPLSVVNRLLKLGNKSLFIN